MPWDVWCILKRRRPKVASNMQHYDLSHMRLITVFLLAAVTLSGWGKTGHRITGQIAENHLTPKAFHGHPRSTRRRIVGRSRQLKTLATAGKPSPPLSLSE